MQKPDTPTGVPPSTDDQRGTPTRVEERGGSLNPASPTKDQRDNKGSSAPTPPAQRRDEALDDALDDTFPGSDPVSITPQPKNQDKPKG